MPFFGLQQNIALLPVQILIFPAAVIAADGDGKAEARQCGALGVALGGRPVGYDASLSQIIIAGQADRAEKIVGISGQTEGNGVLAKLVGFVSKGDHAGVGIFAVCIGLAGKHGNGEVAAELITAAGQQACQAALRLLCFIRGKGIVLTADGELIKFPPAGSKRLVEDIIVSRGN